MQTKLVEVLMSNPFYLYHNIFYKESKYRFIQEIMAIWTKKL